MNTQAPLHLESYHVESLIYHMREGFDQKQLPLERVDVKSDSFQHKDAPNRFMVRLWVKVGQKDGSNARCELDLRLAGFFVLPEGLDRTVQLTMQAQNGPSILYGVARQIVAETTGNGPWGKVFLPTMNFVAMSTTKTQAPRPAQAQPKVPVASDKPARK